MADGPETEDDARPLDLVRLFALGVNQVVGVGIFLLPARLASLLPGAAGPMCIVATAVILAPIALSYAQLARVCGINGGAATYARLAFGRSVETVLLVISAGGMVLGVGAIASGISEMVLPASPALARALAASIVLALGAAASRRVAVSARVWTVFTVAKMAPLMSLAVACVPPLVAHLRANAAGGTVFTSAATAGRSLLGAPAACLLVIYVFQGFELVPVVAGRSRAWACSVPAAMLLALLTSALLYVVLQLGAVTLLPSGATTSAAPLVDLARASCGAWLAVALAAGGIVSALGAAFGQLFVATELLAQRTTRGRGSRVGLVVAVALAWVLLVHRSVGLLLSIAGALSLGLYVVTAAALVVLAWQRLHGLRRRDGLVGALALLVTTGAGIWLAHPPD